jgi:hypothetical protein
MTNDQVAGLHKLQSALQGFAGLVFLIGLPVLFPKLSIPHHAAGIPAPSIPNTACQNPLPYVKTHFRTSKPATQKNNSPLSAPSLKVTAVLFPPNSMALPLHDDVFYCLSCLAILPDPAAQLNFEACPVSKIGNHCPERPNFPSR